MAVAIPLIASAFTVSAGVAAGLSTFTGFALAAGGVLTGIGAITGSKDLMKVGAALSLGGAAVGAFGGAAGASGGAAGAGAAEGGSQAAQEAFRASELAQNGATNAAMGATTGAVSPTTSLYQTAADRTAANLPNLVNGGAPAAPAGIMSRAQQSMNNPSAFTAEPAALPDALQQAGQSMSMKDLQGFLAKGWDKVQGAVGNTGNFIKNNKELMQIGGNALASAYGPDAEALDFQKSIYERRRANLNNPIVLGPRS